MKKIPILEHFNGKNVSKKTGGFLYFMSMLSSKVMPYLLRLAAPLMETSIVHWIDKASSGSFRQISGHQFFKKPWR